MLLHNGHWLIVCVLNEMINARKLSSDQTFESQSPLIYELDLAPRINVFRGPFLENARHGPLCQMEGVMSVCLSKWILKVLESLVFEITNQFYHFNYLKPYSLDPLHRYSEFIE